MPVYAVGIDLVEIARIRRMLERYGERFLRRIYTKEEETYALRHQDPAPSLAARFAAKEAFQKCWPEPLLPKEAWVEMEGPRPVLRFSERIAEKMEKERLRAHLSLSHEKGHALAVVVLERP
ncbi:MAG: holo-ACP synthase [Thermaceae bacterium]